MKDCDSVIDETVGSVLLELLQELLESNGNKRF